MKISMLKNLALKSRLCRFLHKQLYNRDRQCMLHPDMLERLVPTLYVSSKNFEMLDVNL